MCTKGPAWGLSRQAGSSKQMKAAFGLGRSRPSMIMQAVFLFCFAVLRANA